MLRSLSLLIPVLISLSSFAQKPSENYLKNQTPTYSEIIDFYKHLDSVYAEGKLMQAGVTDIGKPLHVFVISKNKVFDPAKIKAANKRVILINNGIHPGEPDGIDASMKWSEELLQDISKSKELEHVVLCIIPVYNVDGCLNRGSDFRVNQNGPEEGGFRGNARNLDLNRDCIKMDSENARSFSKIFQYWQPDVFLDNHVSNGADYQYTMTLISTQHNKMQPLLGDFMQQKFTPALFTDMKKRGYEMSPYVESIGETPETGLVEFLETPRFTTGYTTLFNCFGFVSETHMWKPYKDRVLATYEFMKSLLAFTAINYVELGILRKKANDAVMQQQRFALDWELDTMKYSEITFKGYEAIHKTSTISGLQRLYYDRSKPFTKKIKFYDNYTPTVEVDKPAYYIIPQAWREVIDRLTRNKVKFRILQRDTAIEVETYYIVNYKTSERPYEGHYLHSKVQLRKELQKIRYNTGDFIVPTDQSANRYIVETLEPQGVDSYFAWNFFDAVLQQKEWFSDYIFEDLAEKILAENPQLQKELKEKQEKDAAFAKSQWAQLTFIFQHSKYYEKTHLRYPVGRILH